MHFRGHLAIITGFIWLAGLSALANTFLGPDRVSQIFLGLLGLYGLRIVVGIGVVLFGFWAWQFKQTDVFAYGVAEVLFAGLSGAYVAAGLTPGDIVLSQWTTLIASAYVVARGVGNISDGMKQHREGKFGPLSFAVRSAWSNFWSERSYPRVFYFLPFRSEEEKRNFKKWKRLHAFDDPMDFIREQDRDKPAHQRRG